MRVVFRMGERIYLSPVEKSDAEVMQAWYNDEEVQRYLLQAKPINLDQEIGHLERASASKDSVTLAIVEKAAEKLIGSISLFNIHNPHRSATLGVSIGEKAYWSKGLGEEAIRLMLKYAFGTLNLNKVSLCVLSTNPRAKRCYEKCGFAEEGVERMGAYRDGKYEDIIHMSILKREYFN